MTLFVYFYFLLSVIVTCISKRCEKVYDVQQVGNVSFYCPVFISIEIQRRLRDFSEVYVRY